VKEFQVQHMLMDFTELIVKTTQNAGVLVRHSTLAVLRSYAGERLSYNFCWLAVTDSPNPPTSCYPAATIRDVTARVGYVQSV